jgi:hypothetical protein
MEEKEYIRIRFKNSGKYELYELRSVAEMRLTHLGYTYSGKAGYNNKLCYGSTRIWYKKENKQIIDEAVVELFVKESEKDIL